MKALMWLALSLSFSPFAHANIFVGNAGQGVDTGGKLYLRDLFSAGVHLAPYFGPNVDLELPTLPGPPAINFAYPRDLLARKLTDLNEASPGLGDFILTTMKLYVWTLQDSPLTTVEDSEDPVKIPARAKIRQLANRFQTSIRINRAGWQRLDDANKVALLIHEAVFSLVRPTISNDGLAAQSAHIARELTGSFFTQAYLAKPKEFIADSIFYNLSVPRTLYPIAELRQESAWLIHYSTADKSSGPLEIPTLHSSQNGLEATLTIACKAAKALSRTNSQILILLRRPPVHVSTLYYSVNSHAHKTQMAVNIGSRAAEETVLKSFISTQNCIEILLNTLSNLSWDPS